MEEKFTLCPVCKNKTKTKVRPETEAKNLPVLCRVCKNEFIMNIKNGRAETFFQISI